jgi:hypothetical protein
MLNIVKHLFTSVFINMIVIYQSLNPGSDKNYN